MYSILIAPESSRPFIISQNTYIYVEYMDSGYEQIASGTRKELEIILEEAISAYAD